MTIPHTTQSSTPHNMVDGWIMHVEGLTSHLASRPSVLYIDPIHLLNHSCVAGLPYLVRQTMSFSALNWQLLHMCSEATQRHITLLSTLVKWQA